jgi:hypothetical protein
MAGAMACAAPYQLVPMRDGPAQSPTPAPVAATAAIEASPSPTAIDGGASDPSSGAQPGWLRFADDVHGLGFDYPADWQGPEVHRWDAGISVEVGSDVVYPYGTGLDETHYQQADAYYVTVQYVPNRNGWPWDQFVSNSPWMETYLAVESLDDGESFSTARSLVIREGARQVGRFQGVEYIATLSETAQTEISYVREALLFDDALNYVRVSGQPNNVRIGQDETWRPAYERVDAQYQATFHMILESISVER